MEPTCGGLHFGPILRQVEVSSSVELVRSKVLSLYNFFCHCLLLFRKFSLALSLFRQWMSCYRITEELTFHILYNRLNCYINCNYLHQIILVQQWRLGQKKKKVKSKFRSHNLLTNRHQTLVISFGTAPNFSCVMIHLFRTVHYTFDTIIWIFI